VVVAVSERGQNNAGEFHELVGLLIGGLSDVYSASSKASCIISGPTEEEIRRRAYEIYLQHGAVSGGELDDWLRAERELNRIALYNRSRRRVST
jgi:hypothetical protein